MLDTITQSYSCDFCHLTHARINDVDKLQHWNAGQQGFIFPVLPYSGWLGRPVLHACHDPLCQAKLLLWTRS